MVTDLLFLSATRLARLIREGDVSSASSAGLGCRNDHVTIAIAQHLEHALGGWVPPPQ